MQKNGQYMKKCFYYKIHNFNPIITKLCQNKYSIMTKFCNDLVKIVDFLIKAYLLRKSQIGWPGLYV